MVITRIRKDKNIVDGAYEVEGRKYTFASSITTNGTLMIALFAGKEIKAYNIKDPAQCPGRIGQLARRIICEFNDKTMKVRK